MTEPEPIAALVALQEMVATILDMVDAYRAAACARGYSPTAAEMMAVEFNGALFAQIRAQANP